MSNIGIYKITNKVNGNCYVGQSRNIFKRWSVHGNKNNANNCNTAIAKAIKKHGVENFIFEILELCTIEELNDKEKYWILKYNSFKNGYNSTSGGDAPEEIENSILKKEEVVLIQQQLLENRIPIVELAKIYNVSEGTIRSINTGLCWFSEGLEYPLRSGNTAYWKDIKKNHTCLNCSVSINRGAKTQLCVKCSNISRRKIKRPTRHELLVQVINTSKVEIAKIYKVSDRLIGKWCKIYNIPSNRGDYKKLKWYAYPESNGELVLRRDLVYPVSL